MPAPIASWNPERDVWESAEMDLFSGLSAVYSETFPVSGSMRSGSVYARPTSVPLTAGSASSSSPGLMPTPRTSDAVAGRLDPSQTRPDRLQMRDVATLLPTPTASDTNGTGAHGTGGPDLRTAVELLPTPTATPYGNNQSPSPGAAVRPSLDSLAPMLLPTPKATNNENRQSLDRYGMNLGMALEELLGASTPPPSTDGNAA